jgi:hypothetical protein
MSEAITCCVGLPRNIAYVAADIQSVLGRLRA